jgi:hypothetical protein
MAKLSLFTTIIKRQIKAAKTARARTARPLSTGFFVPSHGADLRLRGSLWQLRHNTGKIRSFFQKDTLKYAA